MLYLIEILHQTTTYGRQRVSQKCCILSKFYIKPQQPLALVEIRGCCILSKFYIKPQQCPDCLVSFEVVSYRNSTSNHNYLRVKCGHFVLYLIEILHQTTTACAFFVIPQLLYLIEILHQTTTLPLAVR